MPAAAAATGSNIAHALFNVPHSFFQPRQHAKREVRLSEQVDPRIQSSGVDVAAYEIYLSGLDAAQYDGLCRYIRSHMLRTGLVNAQEADAMRGDGVFTPLRFKDIITHIIFFSLVHSYHIRRCDRGISRVASDAAVA